MAGKPEIKFHLTPVVVDTEFFFVTANCMLALSDLLLDFEVAR